MTRVLTHLLICVVGTPALRLLGYRPVTALRLLGYRSTRDLALFTPVLGCTHADPLSIGVFVYGGYFPV